MTVAGRAIAGQPRCDCHEELRFFLTILTAARLVEIMRRSRLVSQHFSPFYAITATKASYLTNSSLTIVNLSQFCYGLYSIFFYRMQYFTRTYYLLLISEFLQLDTQFLINLKQGVSEE